MNEMVNGLTPLDEAQVAFFEENGYLLLRNACSGDLIDIYNQHMYNLAKNDIPNQPDSPEKATFSFRVFNPHLKDSFSMQMMKLPLIRGGLAQLMGDEGVGVQSMFFFKEPGSKGQAAHQDYEYIHHEPNTMIATSLAMEQIDEENGCLYVIPGSHKLGPLPHGKVKNLLEHADWTTETEGVDLSQEIPVFMEKGDILFFHCLLVHSSTRNKTKDRFRRSYVCHYIRHDSMVTKREDLKKKIPLY
ncbi:phytanoyl-CoA dioxygenase family protein [Paenibacillus silvisoli]|uniref:phytanoyl-CoA dioxygenase family protein n=1 Tax=Paenibacillus silvisoli TaxID=3110539 RepID=UPI0028062364|nr:phytanoyl-CoA dioxygenase family protein [Paenibacillus silvisoli]